MNTTDRLFPFPSRFGSQLMFNRSLLSRRLLLGLGLITSVSVACDGTAPPPPPPPPPVTVAMPINRTVIQNLYFTGRTEAVESAEIRARVPGYLVGMHYRVAAEVDAGDVLFTIEDDSYTAARNQRGAAVASAKANLKRAEADLERVQQAVKTNAVSEQEVSLRLAERDMAVASKLEAEANLVKAELDLSYCEVKSPIEGQVSRNLVDVGNLVGSGQNTLLATVAKMDPIHVYFEASEDKVLKNLKRHQGMDSKRLEIEPVKALLGLGNETDYPYEGVLDYIDNRVDTDTGTITIRGTFPNADRALFPGLFARISVPGDEIEGAVLVEERAIGTDLGGKYVLVVDESDMVAVQHLELGALEGELRVVISGLAPDQRYIVSGLLRARPGRPCTPTMQSESKATPTGN